MIDSARTLAAFVALAALASCDRVFGFGSAVLADATGPERELAYCPPVTLGMTLPCIDSTAGVQFVHGAIDTGDLGCAGVGGVVVAAPSGEACVLSGVSVQVTQFVIATGPRALVLSSATTIDLAARIDLDSTTQCPARAGAGSPTCTSSNGIGGTTAGGGGGGGSYQTAGGDGGSGAAGALGGGAGATQPLGVRGGCAGGIGGAPGNNGGLAGAGGGAFVAIARDSIAISGDVLAGGAGGESATTASNGGGGGGAGGAIVFAAPTISASSHPRLCANGGGGGAGAPPLTFNAGDACFATNDTATGANGAQSGGDGSTGLAPGGSPSGVSSAGGGGGGGGAGYIVMLHATLDTAAVDASPPITFAP